MLKHVTHVGLGVNDQDEALAFWTEKIGFELRNDVTIPQIGLRWLTVGPPKQPDVEIILLPPGGPGTPPDVVEKAQGGAGARRAARHDLPGRRLPGDLRRAQVTRRRDGPGADASSPTASTRRSATRPATTSGSRR